jgi:PAS domain S-box-containing protein
MKTQLRVLMIEDSESDAELIIRPLKKAGYDLIFERVETAQQLKTALENKPWDIIISDYRLPHLEAPTALAILQETGLDIPFIVVSNTIGEETAVSMMKSGAHDYLKKDELTRLSPAVAREIADARVRHERNRIEEALLASELRYRRLFESAKDGILILDAETGVILDANPFLIDMLGLSHEEFCGKALWELGFFKDIAANEDRFFELKEKEYVRYEDLPLEATDGRKIDVEFVSNVYGVDHRRVIQCNIRDITERKRAERLVQQSEERHRIIAELATDYVYAGWLSPNGNVQTEWISGAFEQITGYTFEQAKELPHGFSSLVLAEDLDKIISKQPLLFRKESIVVEYRIKCKNGDIRWLRDYMKPVLEKTARSGIRLLGAVQDITERKLAEVALKHEQNLLQALMDNIPDHIYFKDSASRFIRMNKAHADRFGLGDPAQAVGKTDFDFFTKDHAQTAYNDEQEIIRSGQPIVNKEEKETWPDDHETWASTTKVPLRDQNGRITGTVGISRDITERKQTEEALETQSLYFRQLFESSPAGTVMLDSQFSIINVNQAFTTLFQYSLEEVKGKNIYSLIIPDDKLEEAKDLSDQIIQSGSGPMVETKRKRKDGTQTEVLVSGHRIIHKNQIVGFYFMYVDISRQKRLQEQLIQAQKMESLGTLAGGMAHDFNNILAIMLGHASLIEIVHNDPVRLKGSLDNIIKAGERGASLVRQMLTFARKGDVEFKPVSINDFIKEIDKIIRETFPKTMTLSCSLAENLPMINADSTQIHQVLLNLCVNARDAMNGVGTLTIATGSESGETLRSQFPDVVAEKYISIELHDTGTGMDETTLQHIFVPFFTTKSPGKGTGLGLAVVFGIMESHEGFIGVQSKPGHGTSFFLYFPVKPLISVLPVRKKESHGEVHGGTETILVIEDEELLRELIHINLLQKGYKVLTASDGEEGIEKYKINQHTIGLVLSDLGMPKLTGHEVLKKLKKINPSLKFILASGFNDPIEKSQILKDGADMIVQKPYNVDGLLRTIRAVLDGESTQ